MLGADLIATGHYVRKEAVTSDDGKESTYLLKGCDNNKDQSYFLCAVGEKEIAKTLFPVGELPKPEVRAIAEQFDLVTHNKKDSTGICFIGERRFSDFLEQYLPAQPGPIKNFEGEVMGEHRGLMYHTIGQRQGLGIGGIHGASDDPWYVLEKDLANNTLVVGQGNNHPALFKQQLEANQLNWITNSAPIEEPINCGAKTRYRQPDQECTLTVHEDMSCTVIFNEQQRAITPGQSVVFYQGERCLGGAVITSAS